MKVRASMVIDIPEEVYKHFSESMDVTLYVNNHVDDLLQKADSCDDLPLDWEEVK